MLPLTPGSLQRKLLEIEGWMELRAHDRALELLDELSDAVDPKLLMPIRARCLLAIGRFQEAVPMYEELVEGSRDRTEPLLELAWCHKRIGRPDLAARDMERLIEEDPASSIGHYNLACYLSLAGDLERSLAELRVAISLEPKYVEEAGSESDFDPIRRLPEFAALVRWGAEELERRRSKENA
jgi:tetratricopeptide (TPR) repeat protein